MKDFFYKPQIPGFWAGRIDGNAPEQLRWHQVIRFVDVSAESLPDVKDSVAFLGFACDEGVRRNQGRRGAANGPNALRKACSSLPLHTDKVLLDAGDVLCPRGEIEEAQGQLTLAVHKLLEAGAFPLLLGGGHEITYGHYQGIRKAFPEKSIGVINLDAHFDLRNPDLVGISSGTGFFQIAQDCQEKNLGFHYLALGIQTTSNTQTLFNTAQEFGVEYVLDKELESWPLERIGGTIRDFIEKVDLVYLTLDLDVFSSAYAPGVSAPNSRGLIPGPISDSILETIFSSQKVVSMDVAEYNPALDLDNRTGSLAARTLFDTLNLL